MAFFVRPKGNPLSHTAIDIMELLTFLRGAKPDVAQRRLTETLDLQYRHGHVDGYREGRGAHLGEPIPGAPPGGVPC